MFSFPVGKSHLNYDELMVPDHDGVLPVALVLYTIDETIDVETARSSRFQSSWPQTPITAAAPAHLPPPLRIPGDSVSAERLGRFFRTRGYQQLNSLQQQAVREIAIGSARPVPYIIFGPPGTGKTTTMCQAALCVHRTRYYH